MYLSILHTKNLNRLKCKVFQIAFTNFYLRTFTMSPTNLFKGHPDRFNGVLVDSTVEHCEFKMFPSNLQESLNAWIKAQRRAIWFKVALEHSDWIPILSKNGFDFHHANKGFVMMYKWLPKDESDNIPPYANTMIGVGGVVINDKSEILVVREKYGLNRWKLPGGYVDPGENLVDAALREILEETHIQTEFRSLLAVRHAHKMMFDCSDLYMVLSLKPLSSEIQKCDREIAESKWIKIDEYLNHPDIHSLNKLFVTTYLAYKKDNMLIECKHGIHDILKKPYTVYVATKNS